MVRRPPFKKAHGELYFEQVAKAYRMIEGEMLPVVVRGYDEEKVNALLETLEQSRDKDERKSAWRALQGYTVNPFTQIRRKSWEAF